MTKTIEQVINSVITESAVTYMKMKDSVTGVAHVVVNLNQFEKNQDESTFAAFKNEFPSLKSLHKLKVLSKNNQNVVVEVEFKRS